MVFETYVSTGRVAFVVELICTIVFAFDYVVYCVVAPTTFGYILSIAGMCDLLSILPGLAMIAGVDQGFYHILPIMRSLKTVRVLRLQRILNELKPSQSSNDIEIHILSLLLVMFGIIFVATGTVFFMSDLDEDNFGEQLQFHDAFYFVITTMTTVGYGDISPQNYHSRLVIVVFMIVCFTIIPYKLSQITSAFNMRDAYRRQYIIRRNIHHVLICAETVSVELIRRFAYEFCQVDHGANHIHTEAVVLCPKSPDTTLRLFMSRTLSKRYLFYIRGSPKTDQGLWMAKAHRAKGIIVLSSFDNRPIEDDTETVLSCIAIKKFVTRQLGLPTVHHTVLHTIRASTRIHKGDEAPHYPLLISQMHSTMTKDKVANVGVDIPLCINEYKINILAYGSVYQGFVSWFTNLVRADFTESSNPFGWEADYSDGANNSVHVLDVSREPLQLTGKEWTAVTRELFMVGVIVAGVCVGVPTENTMVVRHKVVINPSRLLGMPAVYKVFGFARRKETFETAMVPFIALSQDRKEEAERFSESEKAPSSRSHLEPGRGPMIRRVSFRNVSSSRTGMSYRNINQELIDEHGVEPDIQRIMGHLDTFGGRTATTTTSAGESAVAPPSVTNLDAPTKHERESDASSPCDEAKCDVDRALTAPGASVGSQEHTRASYNPQGQNVIHHVALSVQSASKSESPTITTVGGPQEESKQSGESGGGWERLSQVAEAAKDASAQDAKDKVNLREIRRSVVPSCHQLINATLDAGEVDFVAMDAALNELHRDVNEAVRIRHQSFIVQNRMTSTRSMHVENHLVICCGHEGISAERGMPLVRKFIEKVAPMAGWSIVLVHDDAIAYESMLVALHEDIHQYKGTNCPFYRVHERLLFVHGSPHDANKLRLASVQTARAIAIFAGECDDFRKADRHVVLSAIEVDTMLDPDQYRKIFTVCALGDEEHVVFLRDNPDDCGKRTSQNTDESDVFFPAPAPAPAPSTVGSKPDVHCWPLFAAGRIYSQSVLDTLVVQLYFNPEQARFWECVFAATDEAQMFSQCLLPDFFRDEIVAGKIVHYEDLFDYMTSRLVLPVGLFRAPGTLQSPLGYTHACPPPKLELNENDKVFIFGKIGMSVRRGMASRLDQGNGNEIARHRAQFIGRLPFLKRGMSMM